MKGTKIVDNGVEIKDPAKALAEMVSTVNKINVALKERNLKTTDKENLVKSMEATVDTIISITSAGINNGLLDSDKYGVLKANVDTKAFKNCAGHVNAICKRVLVERMTTPVHDGALLSDTELAKLIAIPEQVQFHPVDENGNRIVPEATEERTPGIVEVSPQQVPTPNDDTIVEITSTEGDSVIFDKINNTAYVNGVKEDGEQVIYKKTFKDTVGDWRTKAWNIATACFKLVRDLVVTAICAPVNLLVGGSALLIDTVWSATSATTEAVSSWFGRVKGAVTGEKPTKTLTA